MADRDETRQDAQKASDEPPVHGENWITKTPTNLFFPKRAAIGMGGYVSQKKVAQAGSSEEDPNLVLPRSRRDGQAGSRVVEERQDFVTELGHHLVGRSFDRQADDGFDVGGAEVEPAAVPK